MPVALFRIVSLVGLTLFLAFAGHATPNQTRAGSKPTASGKKANSKSPGKPYTLAEAKRVVALIRQHPTLSLDKIAALCRVDPFLSAQREVWNRDTIKKLRTLGGDTENRTGKFSPQIRSVVRSLMEAHPLASYEQLVDMLQSDPRAHHPRIRWSAYSLADLVERYPDEIPSRARTFTAETRGRAKQILAENPHLTYEQIAEIFQEDSVLSKVRTRWRSNTVSDLVSRYPDEFVRRSANRTTQNTPAKQASANKRIDAEPSTNQQRPGSRAIQEQNDRALAAPFAAALRIKPGPLTIKQILSYVEVLGHGRYTFDRLLKMAEQHPPLANILFEKLWTRPQTGPLPPVRLRVEQARKIRHEINLRPATLLPIFEQSPVVAQWVAKLAKVERIHGNDDGVLSPRDMQNAPKELRLLMTKVYARVGSQRLDIAALPHLIAATLANLQVDDTDNATFLVPLLNYFVETYSSSYTELVANGAMSETQFIQKHRSPYRPLAELRAMFPARFPQKTGMPLPKLAEIIKVLGNNPMRLRHLAGLNQGTARLAKQLYPEIFAQPSDVAKTQHTIATAIKPALGNSKPAFSRQEFAAAFSTRTELLLQEDFMLTRDDIFAAINRDPEFIAQFGKITLGRYNGLRADFPLVSLRDNLSTRIARLATESETFIATEKARGRQPNRSEVFQYLTAKHPRFGQGHWTKLRRVSQTVRELPAMEMNERGPRTPAHSLPIRQLARLLVRLHPPGTTRGELEKKQDLLLTQRGLPPVRGLERVSTGWVARGDGNYIYEEAAHTTSEIFAEYAEAAPRGQSSEETIAEIRRDYPLLSPQLLGIYSKLWQLHPESYPTLAKFQRGRSFDFSGRGESNVPLRYRGGWNVKRAVLDHPARQQQLLRGSEHARIAITLPLLDKVLARFRARPLHGKNVLWVTHLQATSFALANSLVKASAPKNRMIVVGTPYGTNPTVKAAMDDMGFDVRVPELSVQAYKAEVHRAVKDMVALYRQNKQRVVVLDDGGLVASILHSTPEYADVLDAISIVEQTTRGITLAEQTVLKVPIVAAARALSKQAEGEFIGLSVATKVTQALSRHGGNLRGKTVAVIGGGGVVGSAVANALREQVGPNGKILVVEPSEVRAQAAARVHTVVEKTAALQLADVVIGCAGEQSMTLDDLKLLRNNAVILSASSKQDEIDMEGLKAKAKTATLIPANNPLIRLPDMRYRLGQKTITVLGDGWPINFDGDVEDIAPEDIQLTRAIMLAGAIQAASLGNRRGIIPFDPKTDKWLLKTFRQMRANQPPGRIGDPNRWHHVIVDLAESIGITI